MILHRLSRMAFVWLLLASSGILAQGGTRPNFLLILADDLGYSDLGCYGGEIQTPNLDALARGGLRFSQFYNTARCWPTRAAILTGYYAQQVRRDSLPNVPSGGQGKRPGWARLLPEYLKPLGYRSYHSGKWHIDGPRLPQGFDRSYSLEDHDRDFHPRTHFEDDNKLPPVATNSGYYMTTAIADHAIRCLQDHARSHAQQPFFHYLCFTAPHFPLQALPDDIARYRQRYQQGWDTTREQRWQRLKALGICDGPPPPREPKTVPPWNFAEAKLREQIGPGEAVWACAWSELTPEQQEFQAIKMAIHAAMVDRMDREIGRVLTQLKNMGAYENTVILFLSDNGASAEQIIRGEGHDTNAPPGSAGTFLCLGPGWSTTANTPFRLHKSWVHEGGICTPLIIHWPQGIPSPGAWRHTPGHVVDLAPTLLEMAGGHWPTQWRDQPVPTPPGHSLATVLQRDHSLARDYFWWFHEGNRAIRVGDWKLVSAGKGGAWELYNLRADRCEQRNLATQQPERTRELAAKWEAVLEEFRRLATADLPQRTAP